MKVAIVYDRVNKFGGAERFLKNILDIFPQAPIYTLVFNKEQASWVGEHEVHPTFLNKIPFFRSHHEILAPIASMAFETHDLRKFDLIISVTSADAKSVITLPYQTHICICLTPTRYLWSSLKIYTKDVKLKLLPKFLLNYFQTVDYLYSSKPDFFISISEEVKKRVKKYYHSDSKVIYPPVDSFFFTKKAVSRDKRGYFLVVSRLVPYKKIDLVVQSFNLNKKKLYIVGDGTELERLRGIAKKNICFLGQVDDIKLKNLYQKAKAVIFPQREDFGLVPLEAQAAGTPVIAYSRGGALETVQKNITGIFFNQQNTSSLNKAITKFLKTKINYNHCILNAKKFRQDKFKKELISYINTCLDSNF